MMHISGDEFRKHLENKIIPFWNSLRDDEYGGFYGYVDGELNVNKTAEKTSEQLGRILWFYSNAYMLLGDAQLLDNARHAYEFLRDRLVKKEQGAVMRSARYDGSTGDEAVYIYSQATAIYGLASYCRAAGESEPAELAFKLFRYIESVCHRSRRYLYAICKESVHDEPIEQLALLRTMINIVGVLEAYTELTIALGDRYECAPVRGRLIGIIEEIRNVIYDPKQRWLQPPTIKTDTHFYAFDIQIAWLLQKALDVVGDDVFTRSMNVMLSALEDNVLSRAQTEYGGLSASGSNTVPLIFDHWGLSEAVVGFAYAWKRRPECPELLKASSDNWHFIEEYIVDRRDNSEWLNSVDENGKNVLDELSGIVGEWKTPGHNGRMCIEMCRLFGESK